MASLHLYTRADLLEGALLRALSGRPVVTCEDHLLLDEVVEEAALKERGRGRPVRLSPLGEGLLLQAVAEEAEGSLAGASTMAGLRRSLQQLFYAAEVAGISPALLSRVAQRAGERKGGSSRLKEVARLYGRYRALLGQRLVDQAGAWRRGVLRLSRERPERLAGPDGPGSPDSPDSIDVHGLWLWPEGGAMPTRQGRLLSLAALCGGDPEPWTQPRQEPEQAASPGTPVRVRVLLPDVQGRPLLEAALLPIEEALYRMHELPIEEVRVPLGRQDDTPYGRMVQGLFRPSSAPPALAEGELPEAQLSLTAAPTQAAEARAVARKVRALLALGVPPGAIVVVGQSAAQRGRLCAALRRYGVPLYVPAPLQGGAPQEQAALGLTPPVQLLLSVYALPEQGVPREALLQALSTRYTRWGKAPGQLPPHRVARALREAGVRDLRPPGPVEEPDYRRRLREWLRQQPKGADASAPPPSAAIAAVESALSLLDGLPPEATWGGHTAALRRLCERLGLIELAQGAAADEAEVDVEVDVPGDARQLLDDGAARARDQDAAAALVQLMDDLPGAAQRLGLHQLRVSRQRFAQLLADVLLATPLPPQGARGAAVTVVDLCGAAGLACEHLCVSGLSDGELPGRAAEDPVLSDDERRTCNRLLSRDVFPLSEGADLLAPLWLAQALGGAQAAHLSWPRSDDQGRPLLRSPFVADVLRAAARREPDPGPYQLVPEQGEAGCAAELWMRGSLDRYGAVYGRARADLGRRQRAGARLLAALREQDPPRAGRLDALVEIERQRLRWFAARPLREELPPSVFEGLAGPFVGRLGDEGLRQTLTERLPGSPQHPLSASALDDYAKCPFRFFIHRVLKAAPVPEGGDDLDPLAGGRLHHEVLEKFFLARQAAGRLPLAGDADDLAVLDEIIEQVLKRWPLTERTGHRELFAVRVRRLRDDLGRLIEREANSPIEEGCVPRLFEHEFGPLAISSSSVRDSGMPLHIKGIIDRVDVGPGRAVVLDYKAGRLDRYEKILRHDLLKTSFQLPLYAAALKADPKLREMGIDVGEVGARYYSLRNGRASIGRLTDQQMISFDPEVMAQAPESNVAEVAYRLWRRLRDGDFRVDPQTCEGCGLEAACRVVRIESPGGEGEGEGAKA